MSNNKNYNIGVIGLGYVGLPLALEFSNHFPVTAYDINTKRVSELKSGIDSTHETSFRQLLACKNVTFSNSIDDLSECNVFIVTVPTPVTNTNQPDLSLLLDASKMIGEFLKQGDVVIYESTVFPGATRDYCVPVLEQSSGLVLNVDFYCGYSPERINPGDKKRSLKSILKVTSGSTPKIANEINDLYGKIIEAGTYMASSIEVAEAAKIIENIQRDVNIALMNELSLIFDKMAINTNEVLTAAATKWNFAAFQPGLVGGHCIGVDPYYLIHKAKMLGYHPALITAARDVNNSIASHVADKVIDLMILRKVDFKNAKVLVMGIAFKENCSDIRNSKIIDTIKKFKSLNIKVDVCDPHVEAVSVKNSYNVDLCTWPPHNSNYSAIIIATAHSEFVEFGIDNIKGYGGNDAVIFDVKSIFPKSEIDLSL